MLCACCATLKALALQLENAPQTHTIFPLSCSQVRLGPLTPHAVRTLRHVKDFLAVQFDLEPEEDTRTIFGTCVGAGLRNLARKTD